jgi:hypothetical protein
MAALDAYRLLCDQMQALQRGDKLTPQFIWLRPGLIDAFSVPCYDSDAESLLEIWLGPSADAATLPAFLVLGKQRVNLQIHPHARVKAHSSSLKRGQSNGLMGCVARDRLQSDRYYVVGCAHVIAPLGDARIGDVVEVSTAGGVARAVLVDWEPFTKAKGAICAGLDAAIAALDRDGYSRLIQSGLPAGISTTYRQDQAVTVRGSIPIAGVLRSRWSGYVDLPGAVPDSYFLLDAVTYQTDSIVAPGESGAGVWDSNNRLLGIHIGAPAGNEQWRANAVMNPIDRIMDWFDIEPLTTGAETPLTPGVAAIISRPEPPAVAAGSEQEITVVAQTLWGEARGEGREGMVAVACVIGNRVSRSNWQRSYVDICRAPLQFSCWNDNDPNRRRLEEVARAPDNDFIDALAIARQLVMRQLGDVTTGATHYYASSMRQKPKWAVGEEPCFILGGHIFFNHIR